MVLFNTVKNNTIGAVLVEIVFNNIYHVVRLPAWEVCELGLQILYDVRGFLRVPRFPPPTKTAKYANIWAVSRLALLFET